MARRARAAPSPSPTKAAQNSASVAANANTLLGFPPAVFLHICLYMDPLSLIYVSRTSKRLRKALLSPKVDRLWVVVRENAFPSRCKRPRDLSEAAWTCLLYYKHCTVCDRIGLKILWSVHLRLCESCEALLKKHHLAGGGTAETYESMFHIAKAFSTRPTRSQLRSKFIEDIRSARPPAVPEESALQIVTKLWVDYISSYGPDPYDEGTYGRFIPLPKDLLSVMETGENPNSRFYALRVIVRAMDFPHFFRAWAVYVEHGLMGLLPRSMDDRDAATSVWRPVSRAQQYLHAPAWWPHAAHLYMHISNPKSSSEPRKLSKEVLCFDERASAVVRSLLVVFELDPLQSTVAVLDSMNMYVQCALCVQDGEERDGLVFHWRHAVFHACTAHQPSSPPRWRRLCHAHAVIAGQRDREHACNTPIWKCGLCAWASRRAVTRAALEAHLVRVHELRPGEIEDGVQVYAEPSRDSLMGLAKPICLWELLENFANTSVLGLSQMDPEVTTTGSSDPFQNNPPEDGCVYIFCLRCPVHARRRHFAGAEAIRTHLRELHENEVDVRGEDYDYL